MVIIVVLVDRLLDAFKCLPESCNDIVEHGMDSQNEYAIAFHNRRANTRYAADG